MMKMQVEGQLMSHCVALLLTLTCASAVQRLDSIDDLKRINFGQSVPKHSLVLLHWFANAVDIDHNNFIHLTFDPIRGDYGSHHYGNYEGLLDPLPSGYRYYTVGNLYQDTSRPLPPYVVNTKTGYKGRNMDRIIIRVRGQSIDQVYITQHSQYQGTYDSDHTYRITPNLLRQIRQFSLGGNLWQLINRFRSNANDFQIRNTWGSLACLGLLLFIVIEEKYSTGFAHNSSTGFSHNSPQNIPRNIPPNRPENNLWRDVLLFIIFLLLLLFLMSVFSAKQRGIV